MLLEHGDSRLLGVIYGIARTRSSLRGDAGKGAGPSGGPFWARHHFWSSGGSDASP
jgi:hypothetical protein